MNEKFMVLKIRKPDRSTVVVSGLVVSEDDRYVTLEVERDSWSAGVVKRQVSIKREHILKVLSA